MSESATLLERVYHWERTTPNRVWLTQPLGAGQVRTWTWKEAVGEARRMAAHLERLGFPPGSNIGLCSKNSAWWVMSDLAIWMAGHVSVPLFPVLTPDIVRYILEHSESRLLIVGKLDPVWEEMKKGVPQGLPTISTPLSPASADASWNELVAAHEPLAQPVERRREELATIIYTSGSTGKPKGAMMSFGIMHDTARNIVPVCGCTERDRALSYLPLAHSYERAWVEALNLYAGGQLFFAESVETFVADLQRAKPTLFISVPQLWLKFQAGVFEKVPPAKLERLLRVPVVSRLVKRKVLRGLGLDHVRFAGSGSAPIPKEVIAWYRALGLDLLEGYAMTENFAYSHFTQPGDARPGYVGKPAEGVECRLSPGGEVLVRSFSTTLGYYRDPEQTAEMLTADGFLKTGDLGWVDAEGRLMITGRVKEIFKTAKGKYIAPAPIENLLLTSPSLAQACVAGAGYAQPYAIAVLSDHGRWRRARGEQPELERELAAHLDGINRNLPRFEQLELLAVVDDVWAPENGFLTPTLKLKRARIEAAYAPLAPRWYEAKERVIWHDAHEVGSEEPTAVSRPHPAAPELPQPTAIPGQAQAGAKGGKP